MNTQDEERHKARWAAEVHRTNAFSKFLHDWAELVSLRAFILEVITDAHLGLSRIEREDLAEMSSARYILKTPIKDFDLYKERLTQVMIVRHVDQFLIYVSDLLTIIFTTTPQMLHSHETVTMHEILEHNSLESLIAAIVDRKVNSLSYKGLCDLNAYLSKQFSFAIAEDDKTLESLTTLVEIRNLITHNQGIVNRIFCSRVKGYNVDDCGRLLTIGFQNLSPWSRFLKQRAEELDTRAVAKFGLPISSPSIYRPYTEAVLAPNIVTE